MKKTIIIILSFLILFPVFVNAESDPVFAFESFEYEVIVGKVVKITPIMQNIEDNKKATYTWSSSDESIATVKKGTVKGIKRGKAKIECIATLKDGGTYIASCTVDVIQPFRWL